MSTPDIKPINLIEYSSKQSKYANVPSLPLRSCIYGPSGSGKSVLLQNMILNIYKGCFERIYIFSPNIHIDSIWYEVKNHIEKDIGKETDDDKFYYDTYREEDLAHIIDTQKNIVKFLKDKGKKKLFNIAVIIDDFADDKAFSRNSVLLHNLFTKGRHYAISSIVCSQKVTLLSPIIRVNCLDLFVYKLRNYSDLFTIVEELSALLDKQTIMNIYEMATKEPYSFLYVKLGSKDINNMFHIRFDKTIKIQD